MGRNNHVEGKALQIWSYHGLSGVTFICGQRPQLNACTHNQNIVCRMLEVHK